VISNEGSQQIGRVSSVDSDHLTIEFDPSITGLVKAGATGVVPVGSINSYLTVPAGPHRLVAVVTAIRMFEERRHGAEPYDVSQSISRQMEAVLVGRFEYGEYRPGISTYPSLFAPVSLATPTDIARIFRPGLGPSIALGEAVVAPEQDVLLDANTLLSRHCVVIGSTGAGKSCTVTAVLDGLLGLNVAQANIVIFDSNGEYGTAFASETSRGRLANACIIGPEPGDQSGLFVPHWFMDNEDHVSLLRAAEGAQAPLLQRAVVDARLGSAADVGLITQLRNVLRSVDDTRFVSLPPGRKPQEAVRATLASLAAGLKANQEQANQAGDAEGEQLWQELQKTATRWETLSLLTGQDAWDRPLTLEQKNGVDAIVAEIEAAIRAQLDQLGLGSEAAASDFDAPRYYSMPDLERIFLPNRIEMESLNEPRIKQYVATLLMRLSRLLADSRYNFMTRVPRFPDALARFLRLILGHDPLKGVVAGEDPPWAATYRSRSKEGRSLHSVTILDLSLVAHDVLENVTALLGRLLFEFAVRVEPRGSFPMLLVLEEAHRYVPHNPAGSQSRSALAFERIAKEGRKFGVSLLAASQRPSDLSRTLLSQAGTLIAHRIASAEDQDLVRYATPLAGREVLRQLPGLAIQHAVVLGESVPAPTYVRIRQVIDPPRSRDPVFIQQWQKTPPPDLGDVIDDVARRWEAGQYETATGPNQPNGPSSDTVPVTPEHGSETGGAGEG
jgi:DNA helicase HerA-like ATPase